MKQVTKQEFFDELYRWGNNKLDPMPSRIEPGVWKCQKTNRLFGHSTGNGYGKNEYFLNEAPVRTDTKDGYK